MNETQKASAGNKIEFALRDYVRELPLYDGDLDINTETETPPAVVVDFRRELSEAHAIIIGTPEYNYNLPGGLKNVVDWASRPFAKHCLIGRRIGVFGCTPGERGGKAAVEYLRNIVPLLGATLVGPELLFPKINSLITPEGILDASVLSPRTQRGPRDHHWYTRIQLQPARRTKKRRRLGIATIRQALPYGSSHRCVWLHAR